MASVDFGDPVIHGVKPADPDMMDIVQSLKLLISILRPFLRFLSECYIESQEFQVRLKRADDLLQKVILECQPLLEAQGDEDWDSSPTNIQLLLSILKTLKIIDGDIQEMADFAEDVSGPNITWKRAQQVVSFIDSVLQNLKNMLICRANTFIPVKREMEELGKGLEFLRFFIRVIANRLIKKDDVKGVFGTAGTLASNISFYLYCSFTDASFEDYMEDFRPNMLELLEDEIDSLRVIFCDESLVGEPDEISTMDEQILELADSLIHKLRKLSDVESPSFIVAAKDLADNLIEELSFLRCNLLDLIVQNPVKEMKSLIISAQDLIVETGIFIFNFSDTTEEDSIAKDCISKIPEALKKVDNLKLQASDLYNKFFSESWKSNFASINVLDYANFLINKLEQLLLPEEAPVNALKPQIETVYEEIVSMRKLLCDITELRNSRVESLLTQSKDAACQAEYAIDSFVAGEGSVWRHKLGLFVVSKDVKILHKELKGILTMSIATGGHAAIPSLSSGDSLQANYPPDIGSKEEINNRVEEAANNIVGLKDSEAKIIELLSGGSEQLKLVSIVGMPGLGKTTLANSVYKHPSIAHHFHVRAWCCVSQVYDEETLLHEILGQIKSVGETNQCNEIIETDLAQKVYQNLKGRRYLIVLDDIWDDKAWYELKGTFPDDNIGSRVLFTTRHKTLASWVGSIQYALRLLSPEESCKLLWLKLFDGETCPPELLAVSTYIARNCKGLPLAVVLVAGVLKGTERTEDRWKHVAETLSRSQVANRKYWEILELSYKHLPDFLKPCFLYLGTFPEDTTISASKFIHLWISEGFFRQQNVAQNNIEREAKNCLNDLVDRSLVMIGRRSSRGGVKVFCVHDVIRDFCSIKLQDEKFLEKEDQFGGISVLHGDLEMNIHSLFYYYRSDRARKMSRNSYFADMSNDCIGDREAYSSIPAWVNKPRRDREALSMLADAKQSRKLDYDFVLQHKLLWVLDLGNVRAECSADTSDLVNISNLLIHLRYLAIRIRTSEIPSEIGNLRKLEFFLLTGAIGKVSLPETIWNLLRLRHFRTDYSFFSFQHCSEDFFLNFSQHDNLKYISALSLRHGNNVEEFILRRLTGIQKLGCKFSNSWDECTGCNFFPVLDFLSELESLKVFFSSKALYPCKFSFPSNLRKLAISSSRLPWDEIAVIGQLPNLEVLKLLNKAFEGQQWNMREGEFQKLKFLKLDSLDIEFWNAYSEHLPCLEQLVVLNCQQLEAIPPSFGEICTLLLIEMKWCSSSATQSVKQILEYQRDMSNDQFNVTVIGPSLI